MQPMGEFYRMRKCRDTRVCQCPQTETETRWTTADFMASAYKGDSDDLRIVLLGVSGAGKSPTANAILGREAFRESRTRESEIQRGRVEDRNISIIDTPGFFNTQLTDEEQQNERMKSMYLCYPGPHVFLLLINLETLEEDERNIVEEIRENFGAQAFQFTMILFTGRETMAHRKWKLFMNSRKFQELVSHCRGQYHAINSKNNIIETQITKLLEKIDDVIKQNDGQHYDISVYLRIPIKSRKGEIKQEKETKKQVKKVRETIHMHSVKEKCTSVTQRKDCISHVTKMEKTEVYEDRCSAVKQEHMSDVYKHLVKSLRRTVQKSEKTCKVTETGKPDQEKKQTVPAVQNRHSTPGESTELRMVMVGKTGVGKSATGNTILGQKVFKDQMCLESVTKECQKQQQTIDGRNISVIDTPGLFDTSISQQQLKNELVRCVYMSAPGPHVFLLVIRLDVRFTDEEKNTVKWIQENFGEEAARYTIILFTRGDQLKTFIEEFLTKNYQIRELVEQCNGGYHVFNNEDEENRSQVSELLEKIDRMVKDNGGEHYTNEMFQDAQRQIWEEEQRRREEEERKKLEEEEKIKEDERNRLLSKAKGVALLSAGVAVGAGATVVASGVTFGPSVMSGMAVAGGAALASVSNGATLSEALLAAGNAALTSVVNGESLPAALMGARAKRSSYR